MSYGIHYLAKDVDHLANLVKHCTMQSYFFFGGGCGTKEIRIKVLN
jgi:hypothetical protein